MYKVFVNKTPIVLTDNIEVSFQKECKVIPFKNGEQLENLVWELENGKSKVPVYVTHFDIDELWSSFITQFQFVHAAGGMVFNSKNDFLVIHRNGKWDLPKGHLKKGERPEYGGMREVEEECGIEGLEIVAPLANTFHMYDRNGLVLKKTFWYLMHSDFDKELVPQLEEGIDKVEWKTEEDIKNLMKKSYPIIGKLLKKGVKKMKS
jgi:8-oxo-dGTP pyrophosphatase MutT (NUDIX family)